MICAGGTHGTGFVKVQMTSALAHTTMCGDKTSSEPDVCQSEGTGRRAKWRRRIHLVWLAARRKLDQIVPPVVRENSIRAVRTPRLRVAGFVVSLLIGALTITWINIGVRERMHDLERDFGAVKTERFYQAVHIRQSLRSMNDYLLEYQVTGDRLPLLNFRTKAQKLTDWIQSRIEESGSEEERHIMAQLADAFHDYKMHSTSLQERPGFLPRMLTSSSTQVDQVKEKLDHLARPVLNLCERLMLTQRGAFSSFLDTSQQSLDALQQWIKISLMVLLVLAASVALLVYRGMIAPLRDQLSESHAIIARQEKLAALGSLAAGVAHEIRNPLTAIKFRLFSLKKSLPGSIADNEDATVIGGEISRLERIVRDFLEFARPSDPETASVSARQLLEEVAGLMRPQLEESRIKLNVDNANGLCLKIDFQQIKQVLINLIRNAAESIDGEGDITLRAYTDAAPLAGKRIAVAVVEVADTGKGMPPEVSRRLFDPFFTTKDNGTGLGLSIAARIVEKHGGELTFESQVDHGTKFKLLLPTPVDDETPHTLN